MRSAGEGVLIAMIGNSLRKRKILVGKETISVSQRSVLGTSNGLIYIIASCEVLVYVNAFVLEIEPMQAKVEVAVGRMDRWTEKTEAIIFNKSKVYEHESSKYTVTIRLSGRNYN